ncbi:MAG: DUF5615 family PIN-like protein [Verrucomicrobiota bacterium]
MPTGLFADVHVPGPVVAQLRLRGVDILASTEEGRERATDEELLELATSMQRIMITQDIRFRVRAEEWLRSRKTFAGLIFAHQRYVSFGQMVLDLELIAKATDPSDWENHIEQLPL